MSVIQEQIEEVLLPGMTVPEPLGRLFNWIENNGLFVASNGRRLGFLYPDDKLKSGWTDKERPGGTIIEFAAEGNVNMKYWFGHERPEVLNRLCVFAQTGAEGSMGAFWLDDDGRQRIVHMGSGSGSTLVCVLADDPVDFIRLLAIGYGEICWGGFSQPPNAEDGMRVRPNAEFQQWVRTTFGVSIPKSGAKIVKHPAKMGDKDPEDPFARWVNANTA